MLDIYRAIDAIVDAYNLDLPEFYKRRDPKEPGRAEKEMFEDKLARLLKKRFKAQKVILAESLQWILPMKGTQYDIEGWMPRIPPLKDPKTEKEIFKLFIGAMRFGKQLFGANITFDLNWEQYDANASAWAKQYLHQGMAEGLQGFFDSLDGTTMATLKQELGNFVEMPGYTIQDVMRGLDGTVLGGERAQRVAVTEITRVFAESDDIAGKLLEDEYPEVRVIKTWFTNNDGLVCDICRPMNGISVLRSDFFPNELGEDLDGPPAHPNCRCWRMTSTDINGSVELG
jgi:hypothetical protein